MRSASESRIIAADLWQGNPLDEFKVRTGTDREACRRVRRVMGRAAGSMIFLDQPPSLPAATFQPPTPGVRTAASSRDGRKGDTVDELSDEALAERSVCRFCGLAVAFLGSGGGVRAQAPDDTRVGTPSPSGLCALASSLGCP